MKRKLIIVVLLAWVCLALVAAIAFLPSQVATAETTELSPQEQQEVRKGYVITPVRLNLQGKNHDLVGLGSYIVNAQAGCSGCHTNPEFTPGHNPFLGQPARINKEHYLAGGQQFGPFTSRNLTPDENGLPAGLTLNQFAQVMRKGTDFKYLPPHVPSDDKDLLQVMPWPYYRNMTDRDIHSIYEYLRAIPHAEPGSSSGATLTHDYELNGTLADAMGGPSLVPYGGILNATNYSFGENEGLSLSNAIVPGNYSIEMIFNLDNIDGWKRLVEFKNLGAVTGEDEGLYAYNGMMYYWPVTNAPNGTLDPQVDADVVLTRDGASGLFVVYVNGVEQLSFTDSNNLAVFNGPDNIIYFFVDDFVIPGDYPAGVVDRIRIYSGALSSTQVAALESSRGRGKAPTAKP